MDFDVGQVIFLLSNKDVRVFPALVTEQIDKKTMAGREKHYVVRLTDKEETEIGLEKIDAQVFEGVSLLFYGVVELDNLVGEVFEHLTDKDVLLPPLVVLDDQCLELLGEVDPFESVRFLEVFDGFSEQPL